LTNLIKFVSKLVIFRHKSYN